jgi:diguanylate cyclase (GGDEF)-like protein
MSWDAPLVTTSWALGCTLAVAAMLAFHRASGLRANVTAAGLLTLAICGLHFTSMGAVTILPDPTIVVQPSGLNRAHMAIAVAGVTFIVLLSALAAALIQTANFRFESSLREQKERFESALRHLPVGFSMFDSAHRFIMCNGHYRAIYDLPEEIVKPGTTFAEILRYHTNRVSGQKADTDPESTRNWLTAHFAKIACGKPFTDIQHLSDGRTISVTIEPMADGGWVDVQEDITERTQHEAQITHMSRHDALTDLPNRLLLRDRLEAALMSGRGGGTFAVHCLDLDHFKEVNDILGHPIGDALLEQVAERLRSCVRDGDTVARLGGDEFVVLQISDDPASEAPPLAARIIDAVGAAYDLDGHQVLIGTSIGIALSPSDGTDPDTLLKHGDMALYRAKSEGRGTWSLFEPEMNIRLHARCSLARDLRSALVNGELELNYQPIVNLESGEVSGCEALLRWRHPERGLVSPEEFIPIAEETGLIVPIGEWVLRQACAEAATWPDHIKIAVNISPMQWKCRTLCQMIFNAVAAAGIAPQRLEIEITESSLLDNSEAMIATLRQLHEFGVRIAMDDFGTGYSSLSYLRTLPFDKIKIDRCFVADLSNGGENAVAIVRAISALGRALELTVTAEGVETQEQLEIIRAEGCTEMQGYLFSTPRPAVELGRFFGPPTDKTAALGQDVAA